LLVKEVKTALAGLRITPLIGLNVNGRTTMKALLSKIDHLEGEIDSLEWVIQVSKPNDYARSNIQNRLRLLRTKLSTLQDSANTLKELEKA
jgi:ABC-type branched-subunit amino acid transport system ATPase component